MNYISIKTITVFLVKSGRWVTHAYFFYSSKNYWNYSSKICLKGKELKIQGQKRILLLFLSSPEDTFFFPIAFRERGKGREEHRSERERHRLVLSRMCLGCMHPDGGIVRARTGDWTHNLGMCPVWKSNLQLLGYGTMLQPNEPHWAGGEYFKKL